ncbi:MAG: hypothetical protein ACR2LC_17000 [Pyrinomonadaceae bacterium]
MNQKKNTPRNDKSSMRAETEETESAAEVQERIIREADVIFDLMNGTGLPETFQRNFTDEVAQLLMDTKVDIFRERLLWREAWQLVSERLDAREESEGSGKR